MSTPLQAYIYRARARRVVDGDTLDVTIDVGFQLTTMQRLRLLFIDTAERKGATLAAGNEARDRMVEWLVDIQDVDAAAPDRWGRVELSRGTVSWPLLLRTEKSDAFGRWLAEIWSVDGEPLLETLLEGGTPIWQRS